VPKNSASSASSAVKIFHTGLTTIHRVPANTIGGGAKFAGVTGIQANLVRILGGAIILGGMTIARSNLAVKAIYIPRITTF
jgi:hypothetical protein